ncbi:MAG: sulfotransferase [Pseudomonadota bacterium]
MKKLFLCVGAAKTGTTWLYRNLERNPGLWFTPEKELNYFFTRHGWFDRLTRELRDNRARRVMEKVEARGADPAETATAADWCARYHADPIDAVWYRSLFDGMPEDRWAADFSPSTSLIPSGWDDVASFATELRIVYLMREPQERLWSHAKFHAQFTGVLDRFRTMSLQEIERFVDKSQLLFDGRYGTNLRRMLAHIPREHILLIDNARVRTHPVDVLREVETFVGLPETPIDDASVNQPINLSERLPMPDGFGDVWRQEFRDELAMLTAEGVAFADDWAALHARLPYRRRSVLARLFGR